MQQQLHTESSLHQVLRNLFRPQRTPLTRVVANSLSLEQANVHERFIRSTVQQLVTSLRMHGIEGEEERMLTSLELLLAAGEIDGINFIGRARNLFPKAYDTLDRSIRSKLDSLLSE